MNLKTTLIILFSVIVLGACSSNETFEIYPSGYIIQENRIVDEDTNKYFNAFIRVVSIDKISEVVTKHGSSPLVGEKLDENLWAFMKFSSTLNLESLNGSYTVTASDDNANVDIKEVVFNLKNEEALGHFEISEFSFDGSKITVESKEVENAAYYGLALCVGEKEEDIYKFSNFKWLDNWYSTTPKFSSSPSFLSLESYNAGQQIKVAVIAVYTRSSGGLIVLRSPAKTIEVGKKNFLEDEVIGE